MKIYHSNEKVTENFTHKEFFTKSPLIWRDKNLFKKVNGKFYFTDRSAEVTKAIEVTEKEANFYSHDLDDFVICGAQVIREFLNDEVIITSTFRPLWYNTLPEKYGGVGSTRFSQHPKHRAIDLKPANPHQLHILNNELLKGYNGKYSKLFDRLRREGIGGFGLYNTFLHIDSRSSGKQSDDYGKFAFWDNRG